VAINLKRLIPSAAFSILIALPHLQCATLKVEVFKGRKNARTAVMAQRKGELLKMEMLEKLSRLRSGLEQEVDLAAIPAASV